MSKPAPVAVKENFVLKQGDVFELGGIETIWSDIKQMRLREMIKRPNNRRRGGHLGVKLEGFFWELKTTRILTILAKICQIWRKLAIFGQTGGLCEGFKANRAEVGE